MLVCPRCKNEVFAKVKIDNDGENYSEIYDCPKCGAKLKKEEVIEVKISENEIRE